MSSYGAASAVSGLLLNVVATDTVSAVVKLTQVFDESAQMSRLRHGALFAAVSYGKAL